MNIQDAIVTVSASWALSILVKATLFAALGLCIAGLGRRKPAAVRHTVLAATFGVLVALPLVTAIAPPVGIALRGVRARATAQLVAAARRTPAVARITSETPRWSLGDLLTAAWGAGVVIFLVPAVIGIFQVRRLRRSGLPWQGAPALADGAEVLLHEGLSGPMTCGVVKPAILLPADAASWSPDDLTRAIVHESEHVTRRDWATHCAARVVCAIYWFHPLVWMAWRKLELEAERACDDAVLERSEPAPYADQLVAIARRLSGASRPPLPAMATRVDLASRVRAVLDGAQPRGRTGAVPVAVTAAVAAALVIALSPLRIVAAPQDRPLANFRTETRMFVTEVRVLYPNGRTVEGLGAGDFEVTEDGARQAIQLCEFQKPDPADPASGYYLVGYYVANARAEGQFRSVKVNVKTATAATVEHRTGYYLMPQTGMAVTTTAPAAQTPPPYDRPPALLYKKEPDYSEEARKAKYQGVVTLDVEIDAAGRTSDIGIIRHLGLGLDEKAVEAVKQWRYRPASKDGRPIATRIQVEVSFRLL